MSIYQLFETQIKELYITFWNGKKNDAVSGENSMAVPQNTNIESPYDPKIPLLGTDLKELKADICTPMCVMALFTKTKTWKQPKGPWMDEWGNRM